MERSKRNLCGACHANGVDPEFTKTDFCTICGRTQQQVLDIHGFVKLAEKDLPEEGPALEAERLRTEKKNGKAS